MTTRYLSLFAAIPGLLAGACSVSPPGGRAFGSQLAVSQISSRDAGDAGPSGAAEDDDGGSGDAGQAPSVQSSELCVGMNAQDNSTLMCDPDVPSTASLCDKAPDGGAYDPSAGYGDSTLACRVQPSSAGTTDDLGMGPSCAPAGTGTAGAMCASATDCGAGYDCIGTGTCRHYCCAGNSQCGPQEYCDIQPLATANTTRIPVCMPIVACSLGSALPVPVANAPGCGPMETCGIVREDGTTGCVEVGDVTKGNSCDTGHCQAGLVCLGALNARLCYPLCNTMQSQCPAPMTCQGGLPLFQDPSVGVCR